jgi:hypothetical protein
MKIWKFEKLKENKKTFKRLIGVSTEEFDQLLEQFKKKCYPKSRKKNRLDPKSRLLLTFMWDENLSNRQVNWQLFLI